MKTAEEMQEQIIIKKENTAKFYKEAARQFIEIHTSKLESQLLDGKTAAIEIGKETCKDIAKIESLFYQTLADEIILLLKDLGYKPYVEHHNTLMLYFTVPHMKEKIVEVLEKKTKEEVVNHDRPPKSSLWKYNG